jgi:hypothetical protein
MPMFSQEAFQATLRPTLRRKIYAGVSSSFAYQGFNLSKLRHEARRKPLA